VCWICEESTNILRLIKRHFHNINVPTFQILYKTYVRPNLEYCIQAWCPYLKKRHWMPRKSPTKSDKISSWIETLAILRSLGQATDNNLRKTTDARWSDRDLQNSYRQRMHRKPQIFYLARRKLWSTRAPVQVIQRPKPTWPTKVLLQPKSRRQLE